MDDGPSFCRQLRDVTKEIHDKSDKLVNLKLGVSLSDPGVWANGLFVFAKIFFVLEEYMDEFPCLAELAEIDGLRRTEAFKSDLDFYFGPQVWREKVDNPAVKNYTGHLKSLAAEDDPRTLVAYIYHLYMGLLSGGQLLSKKKQFSPFSSSNQQGNAVTTFDGENISAMKKRIRLATNAIGEDLDEDTREKVLRESVNVFKLNNTIIESVDGVDEIFYKKLRNFSATVCLVGAIAGAYLAYF